jgi:hypothetical protein
VGSVAGQGAGAEEETAAEAKAEDSSEAAGTVEVDEAVECPVVAHEEVVGWALGHSVVEAMGWEDREVEARVEFHAQVEAAMTQSGRGSIRRRTENFVRFC